MKNTLLIFVSTFILFAGCMSIDTLTQFNLEYNETIVIPSSSVINLPFNILTPDIKSNTESTFAVNNTKKDLVEEIKLTQMALTLTSPSNGNLGFLKSIEIFISADSLSNVKIAWNDNIPSNVDKYVELETTQIDLKEYIKKDEFSLKINTVTDEVLTSDYHIDIHSIFFVDANVLGY